MCMNRTEYEHYLVRLSRVLSGYRARRRMADSRGPVLVAGLSLNK
jgi:hypothetical protein